jgi:D-alanyl-D-alanine carboxypeptidase
MQNILNKISENRYSTNANREEEIEPIMEAPEKKKQKWRYNNKPTSSKLDLQEFITEVLPPYISSKSWLVYDGNAEKDIYGRNEKDVREIASLTKTMTCYTVLNLCKRYNIDMKNTHIQVSPDSSKVIGTSAVLKVGHQLTIWMLLHGLMLPSGNDAAHLFAEFFGNLLDKRNDAVIVEERESKFEAPVTHFL